MDTSCWQEEAIAFLHVVAVDGINDSVVGNHVGILSRSDRFLKTAEESCVLVGVEQVPHLCLAALLALTLGYLVGGMNLYREVLTGINKLDEQWELVAKTLVVVLAYEFLLKFGNNLVELLACILAIGNNSLVARHARYFPAFAYILLHCVEVLERNNLFAAPNS